MTARAKVSELWRCVGFMGPLLAVLWIGGGPLVALGADETDSALIDDLRRLIPAEGFVEFMIERDAPPEVQAIGYDIATRTWYQYRAGMGWGYNGGDAPFFVHATDERRSMFGKAKIDLYIEQYAFPAAWLHRAMLERGSILTISRDAEGGYRLLIYGPGGEPSSAANATETERSEWTFEARVSGDAREIELSRASNRVAHTLVVAGAVEPGLPIKSA